MRTINPVLIKDEIYQSFKDIYGEDLISLFIYGQGAEPDFSVKNGRINAAIVLNDASLDQIERCSHVRKKWMQKKVFITYFFTMDFIQSSMDVFPLEFLNMKSSHFLLGGEDILAQLEIKRVHLRSQCEHELRGLVLHLRSEFINTDLNLSKLEGLIKRCLVTFSIIFRGLIFLKQIRIPEQRKDIIGTVEEHYEIGTALTKIYNREYKNDLNGYKNAIYELMKILEKLTKIIDKM